MTQRKNETRDEFLARQRASNAAYRAAHREEIRASSDAYSAAHREERRAYRAAHREEIRAYNAAYRDDKRIRSINARMARLGFAFSDPNAIVESISNAVNDQQTNKRKVA